jgi:hypothetical protein
MKAEQMNTGRGYWLAWFMASVMGYGMGAILGTGLAYGPSFRDLPEGVLGILTGIVMGATGGYFQWVVLRERITGAGLWWSASALGFGTAMGAVAASNTDESYAIAIVLMGSVLGVISGIPQWLVLRRKVPRSGWWLVASCIGSLVGLLDFHFVLALGEAGKWTQAILTFGLLFGAGYGAITGAALVWLLRQSPSSNFEDLATAH